MADELPSLSIDTDWKKQAQEEKRKLAEQAAAKAKGTPAVPPVAGAAVAAPPRAGGAAPASSGRRAKGLRDLPPPGFGGLVQSVMTQVLFYLGEIAAAGGQPVLDLDLAKHHLDMLTMLEEKTKGNLSADEVGLLDAALYETRSRFIGVASQLLGP